MDTLFSKKKAKSGSILLVPAVVYTYGPYGTEEIKTVWANTAHSGYVLTVTAGTGSAERRATTNKR